MIFTLGQKSKHLCHLMKSFLFKVPLIENFISGDIFLPISCRMVLYAIISSGIRFRRSSWYFDYCCFPWIIDLSSLLFRSLRHYSYLLNNSFAFAGPIFGTFVRLITACISGDFSASLPRKILCILWFFIFLSFLDFLTIPNKPIR